MKILLHCCCAPCSIMCISELRKENTDIHLFWFNPNIKPEEEYDKRLECLEIFAKEEKLNLNIELTRINTNECIECYRVRLEETARVAKDNNYDSFTTTLLISPYQDHEAIRRIGEEVADKYGVTFLYRDFRPLFREGQKEARARGFYMQKYCGCGKEENKHRMTRIDTNDKFDRLKLLTGSDGFDKLQQTKVIVFGVGGVGSWCAEALVRSGIGKLDIVDFDNVCESNINRQLQATSKTVGQSKVEVLKQRLLEINPDCEITAHNTLFSKETASLFNIENADYVIDAIDILTHKLDLIETVCNTGVKLYSSMGMALKMDPTRIRTASIWKTDVCPLARLVRQGLRKREFTGDFKVVYSDEEIKNKFLTQSTQRNAKEENLNLKTLRNSAYFAFNKKINGSIVTITASAGLLLANLIIQDVLQ